MSSSALESSRRLADHAGVPFVTLEPTAGAEESYRPVDPAARRLLGDELCQSLGVLPIGVEGGTVLVASAEPVEYLPYDLAAALASQIEAVVAAAERAAEEFRRQVEAAANQQAEDTRQAAESDARRIRQEAATWAAEYLEDSKRIVDEFAAERIAKIGSLTDELIQGAEAVQRRLGEAQNVRRQIYDLISSLGAMAEAIALEAQAAAPELPRPPVDMAADEASSSEEPEPAAGFEPEA